MVVIIITYFRTRKSSIKETTVPDKGQHTGYALIIYIIGSISIGGLHYHLCYGIKFVITLNEGLGLQLLAQSS